MNSATNQPSECLRAMALPGDESVIAASDSLLPMSKNSEEGVMNHDEISSLKKVKIRDEDREAPFPNTNAGGHIGRGEYA